MSTRQEENDIYIMPPNFIDTGTVFGGTIKLRNAAEALAASLLIGINGDSLTSFVINFFVYPKNRRVVGMQEDADEAPVKERKTAKQQNVKSKKAEKKVRLKKENCAEEFGQFRERRQAKQAASAEEL